jgi:hypothetical protein
VRVRGLDVTGMDLQENESPDCLIDLVESQVVLPRHELAQVRWDASERLGHCAGNLPATPESDAENSEPVRGRV